MDTAARIALDLAWLATAEPLMTDTFWERAGIGQARPPAHVAPSDALQPRGRAVGRWFERVHAQAFEREPNVEILAMNHPIHDGTRTLGEIDVLYRRDGAIIHRELAVKYYLAVGDGLRLHDWWGPDRRDRLDRKLERLIGHQLQLPAHAGHHWPTNLPRPTCSEVLFVGALFTQHPTPLPPDVHPQVERGAWWYASDLLRQHPRTWWYELVRPWWLSPAHASRDPETTTAIAARASSQQRPLLVREAGDRTPRGFVLPDGWWSSGVAEGFPR